MAVFQTAAERGRGLFPELFSTNILLLTEQDSQQPEATRNDQTENWKLSTENFLWPQLSTDSTDFHRRATNACIANPKSQIPNLKSQTSIHKSQISSTYHSSLITHHLSLITFHFSLALALFRPEAWRCFKRLLSADGGCFPNFFLPIFCS